MKEEWRQIPGFPDYDVSNQGRVRSYKNSRWGPKKKSTRVLIPLRLARGILGVHLAKDGKQYTKKIASLVAWAFIGPQEKGMMVCHYDDDPGHNVLSNLRYDVRSGNMQDAVRNGRHRGLSYETVREIRERRARGEMTITLAEEYPVSQSAISSMCIGLTYKRAGGPLTRSAYHDGR